MTAHLHPATVFALPALLLAACGDEDTKLPNGIKLVPCAY